MSIYVVSLHGLQMLPQMFMLSEWHHLYIELKQCKVKWCLSTAFADCGHSPPASSYYAVVLTTNMVLQPADRQSKRGRKRSLVLENSLLRRSSQLAHSKHFFIFLLIGLIDVGTKWGNYNSIKYIVPNNWTFFVSHSISVNILLISKREMR